MSEQQSSYRQIMKATSLFGGVQVFNIIISVIRSKFIAVLLGPSGMGILGLLTSSIGLVGGITNFGLGTSAVKDIAAANSTGDINRISTVVIVFRRLVWVTGLLGSFVVLILSPYLSRITFGNNNYTVAFIWISITLLFNQLSSGQLVILQGMRKLHYLAKANLTGSSIGLIVTVPIYYVWGLNGIVPGIITTAIVTLIFTSYYAQKERITSVDVSKAVTIAEGRKMLQMGFIINISFLLQAGAAFLLRIFIRHEGGIDQVGLYNAGFVLINTYAGLIFTAMGTDYYPRLASVAHSNALSKRTINQQAEISVLLISPILIAFIVFVNWIIILLYSRQFVPINDMIYWAALGMLFKAASWAISFLFLVKGGSLFFYNELSANIYILGLNIAGYFFFGLTGLGISFLIGYLIYLVQVFLISKARFEFLFNSDFIKIFGIQLLLLIFSFIAVKSTNNPYSYIFGITLILISTWFSYKELDKRIDIKQIIVGIREKFNI